MKLGGVIFASLGIVVVVLVANGRWDSVWAAALGNNAGSGGGFSATPPTSQLLPGMGGGSSTLPLSGTQGGGFSAPGYSTQSYNSGNGGNVPATYA